MPFMFIGFVAGDIMKVNAMEIWKKFLSAAFIPAAVAIPFCVGYIMLNATVNLAKLPPDTVKGILTERIDGLPGISSLWQLIWMLIAFGVIWVGTFFALKTDSFFSSLVQPIQNVGKSWATFGAKLPLTMPLIPVGTDGGGKMQFDSIGKAMGGKAVMNALKNPNLLIGSDLELGTDNLGAVGGGSTPASAVTNVVNKLEFNTAFTQYSSGADRSVPNVEKMRDILRAEGVKDKLGYDKIIAELKIKGSNITDADARQLLNDLKTNGLDLTK
jgi:hypothetical protein